MSKKFIQIDGYHYNLDMLVTAEEYGNQGIKGYKLTFCTGTFVKFHVPDMPADKFFSCRVSPTKTPEFEKYKEMESLATTVRMYLHSRSIDTGR